MKVFLAAGCQSGSLLRFRGQKRKRRNIKKARPALPEGAGNLRDAELAQRKTSRVVFVESDRRIDVASESLERVGRAGLNRRQAKTIGRQSSKRACDGVADDLVGWAKAVQERLFELTV